MEGVNQPFVQTETTLILVKCNSLLSVFQPYLFFLRAQVSSLKCGPHGRSHPVPVRVLAQDRAPGLITYQP